MLGNGLEEGLSPTPGNRENEVGSIPALDTTKPKNPPMKHPNIITVAIALGSMSLISTALPADGQDPGLIGQRYAGGDLSLEHYHSSRFDDAQGGSLTLNLPVAPGFDANFGYAPSHLMGSNYSRTEGLLRGSLIAYSSDEYGKPFFAVTLAQAWDTTKVMGTSSDNNSTLWGLGAGVEVPYGNDTAMTCSLSYSDAFRSSTRNPAWRYSLQVNHWFTPKVSGVVSLSYDQVSHAPDGLLFTLGARVTF